MFDVFVTDSYNSCVFRLAQCSYQVHNQRGMLLSLMRDICFVALLSGVVELLEHH